MELGVLVSKCPCLATDLANIFGSYWGLTYEGAEANSEYRAKQPIAAFNAQRPLKIRVKGAPTQVFLAVS